MTILCLVCKKDYSSYQSLWRHHKKAHPNKPILKEGDINKKFECEKCNKRFTRKNILENHITPLFI